MNTADQNYMIAKQLGDMKGRRTADRRIQLTAYIDESGDMGLDVMRGASDALVVSATVTDRPKDFESIRGRYAPNTKFGDEGSRRYGELKFSTSTDAVRLDVLDEVRKLDPKIYSVVLMKEDIDPRMTQYDILGGMVKELLADVVAGDGGIYRVTIDEHKKLNQSRRERICRAAIEGTEWEITECKVLDSKYSHGLQVNDFVTGAMSYKYNAAPPRYRDRFYNIIAGNVASIRKASMKR